MEKKVNVEKGLDRISDLPEPIRMHIISFLPTRDAVLLGLLSNSWRALWVELQHLYLTKYKLPKLLTAAKLPDPCEDDAATARREFKRENFYDFVDQTLGTMKVVEKLSLYVPGFSPELSSRLDGWVNRAVGYRLKELDLGIGTSKVSRYVLPKNIFCANMMTRLKLQSCEVKMCCLTDTHLPSLHVLYLGCVYTSDETIASLLASCPKLKEFTFNNCHGVSTLEIIGLTRLDKVKVEQFSEELEVIKLEAPNLLDFIYSFAGLADELSCEIEMAACRNMKYLILEGASLDDYDLHHLLSKLLLLERVGLYNCNNLRHVEISGGNLVHLEFIHCRNLLKVNVNTPNLKFFHYEEADPIYFVSKGSELNLTEASVYLKPDTKNGKWYASLIKFLEQLSQCKRLTLTVGREEDLIIPEHLRMKSRPPLYRVNHLMVQLRASFMKHTPVRFVEALLWLVPCPELISIDNDYIPVYKLLKLTYEKPSKFKKKCGCWSSLPINCWRHSLNKVSIENQIGVEDDTSLADFLGNGRLDKKISVESRILS